MMEGVDLEYTILLPLPLPGLIAGDWIDCLTGDVIIGPYCQWPKKKPRIFKVSWSKEFGVTVA